MKDKSIPIMTENHIKPLRRKILALSGAVRNLNRLDEKNTCRVSSFVAGQSVSFRCNNFKQAYYMGLNYTQNAGSCYEITTLRGYGFNRGSLYTGFSEDSAYTPHITAKKLIKLTIDAVNYTDFSVLEDENFVFHNLNLSYTVTLDTGAQILVTLIVNSSGFKVIETVKEGTVALRKDAITSSTLVEICKHSNVFVFTNGGVDKPIVEKIEDYGTTVIKTIDLVGVL